MAIEDDSEHVIAFALEPICHRPYFAEARHRFVFAEMRFQAQALVLRKRVQNQNHVETFFALRPIDGGEIVEHVELFVVAAIARNFAQLIGGDEHDGLLAVLRRVSDGIAKPGFQALYELVIERSWSFFRWRWRSWRLRRRGSGGSAVSSRFGRSSRLRWCGWRRRSGRCAFSRRFRWDRRSLRCRFRRIGGRFGSWRLFRGIVSHRFDRPQSSSNDERIRSIAREQPAFLTHPKKQRQRIRTDISDQLRPSREHLCDRARCSRPAKFQERRAWSAARKRRAGCI